MKKIVSVLIGIILISFGIGFLTLKLPKDNLDNGFNLEFGDKNYLININSNKTNVGKKTGNYVNIDEKDTVSINGVQEIEIDADIATINIIPKDTDDISLHYHGRISPHIKTNFKTRISGKKLIVQAKAKNLKSNFNLSTKADLYLDIIVPLSYSNNLNLVANLGAIKIEDLGLNKLYIKGELGDIDISNIALNELEAKSSLGKISIDNISSSKNKLSTDLGAIEAKNIEGPLEAKTNLGSIDLEYDKIDWDIKAESDSGSIKILLPSDSNFHIDASTDLGNIKNNYPLDISEKSDTKLKGKVGNGKNNITLSVSLGSININSK
ncbi:hypothetical protein CULT_110058 [[Clostridium] ultunense Esp]|uniref:DUF4097 domain-containing protein n=1 Tax=[Clostridium] ultunense Esp TaxID=1288971 RepID=M1YQK1_9FIRM|nr:DUF4097 family beta strand repeat-containing protein [Schnuerera ultunensis]CCQ92820.1 hypothetical protein CULT_110058 [[Clostridium] ultunense Esp]SHD75834.1 conserved protein of unknown function [[Clostridium] ultunense Esp]